MPTCYLGLGSNLKSPKRQLHNAIYAIQKMQKVIIKDISSFYFNKPVGIKAQPMFYNLVIKINTSLNPNDLLINLKKIEKKQQRITKKRWGARTIDIDILLYGNKKINYPHLKIPHPHMHERDFVLIPMMEVSKLTK